METKFTRGEWRIYDMPLPSRKVIEIIGDGEVIASIKIKKGKYYSIKQVPEKYQANTKLISKSPQMFETITNFIHWIEREKETVSGALLAEMDSAKILIKKITE